MRELKERIIPAIYPSTNRFEKEAFSHSVFYNEKKSLFRRRQ